MSMKTLESAILAELRQVTGRRALRLKDVMEWSTGEVSPADDETLVYLPELQINCAVLTAKLGRAAAKEAL